MFRLLFMLITVYCCVPTCICEEKQLALGKYNWICLVFTDSNVFMGALIEKDTVLTTAHYLLRNGAPIVAQKIRVAFNGNLINTISWLPKEYVTVKEFKIHDNYVKKKQFDDVAILKLNLDKSAKEYTSKAAIVSLPKTTCSKELIKSEVYSIGLNNFNGFGPKISSLSREFGQTNILSTPDCLENNKVQLHSEIKNQNLLCTKGENNPFLSSKIDNFIYTRSSTNVVTLLGLPVSIRDEMDDVLVFTNVYQYLKWIKSASSSESGFFGSIKSIFDTSNLLNLFK